MWTVVFIAPTKTSAETYKKILVEEGLLVQLRPIGNSNNHEHSSVEILVPESEAEEAQVIILNVRGT